MIETADSISSKIRVRILDIISEGEIEGLVDGEKSIYLNETPLVNSNGTKNFTDATYYLTTGSNSQSYISDFSNASTEIQVGVQLDYNTGVVRTISDTDVNRFNILLSFNSLQYINQSNGDVTGNAVTVAVEVQPNGGGYQTVKTMTIDGKKSGPFQWSSEPLTLPGSGPWNIKLTRTTGAPAGQFDQNVVSWGSYSEIIDAKLRYPNTALAGVRFYSTDFNSTPSRYYYVKLLKIKVPSNYNPTTRTYSGSWNGTFQTAWSDNPAWCYYDLLTNSRYGLGQFISTSQIDKYALYSIGQYCDELVPDGYGGTEPRFTCNAMVTDRTDAYSLLSAIASTFRTMIYWGAGSIIAVQDSPSDPTYIFNPSNVVDGRFTYAGTSLKTRHSAALVKWNDPTDFCRTKVEYVEDRDAIARYGLNQLEINAFGCTSRGQAHRIGKWALYTEQNESETVAFKTGLEGATLRPGQIIKIADPVKAGIRLGGRVSTATTTTVTADANQEASSIGGLLSVILSNGTTETRTITGISGAVITVQPAFTSAPVTQSPWVIKSPSVDVQTFRVITIKEEDKLYTVTAIKHDPQKYASIEQNIKLTPRDISDLKQVPDPPTNVVVTESLYQSGSNVKAKISVTFEKSELGQSYVLSYKRDNENIVTLKETEQSEIEILDVLPGFYKFNLQAKSVLGKLSGIVGATKEIFGKTAPPVDVTGFSLIPNQGNAYLSWNQATDLDVLVGGQVRIRYTPLTTGQQWKNTIDIIPAVPGAATSAVAPLLEGTYMIKFVDSSGNYSANASEIVTISPEIYALNLVDTQTDSPTFAGSKYQMTIDTAESALVLAAGQLVDDFPLIDEVGNWDFSGDIYSDGTYTFENIVDLGSVYPATITANIEVEAFNNDYIWDSRGTLIDTWTDIDGSEVNDVNAELFVRTTEDDPNATPTWTVWKRVHQGSYNARGFQYQLRATSGDPTHNLWIRTLEVTLDMKDRTVNMGPLSSGTGSFYTVTYADPFYATPAISVTSSGMQTGDYFTITSETESGFNIVFKNSSGTIVNRTFSVIAKGYGRKVA